MMLSKISQFNQEKEVKSLHDIFQSIDKYQSIIFNSGAGAGKTYALIESLKYVIKEYGEVIKKHNQKIACITYTNVATKEVKERLGNADIVQVSTIHERIWELIKDHQNELVGIHKEKLGKEISDLKEKVERIERYQELTVVQRENLRTIMSESKELFYKNRNVKAAQLKEIFQPLLTEFPSLIKNVSQFKDIVKTIYKIEKFTECYQNISLNNQGYKSIEYNSIYNVDQLHKMRISHDTLLEYGLELVKRYDLFKQLIIDKYPFIFIDEYQDTDENVVLIMSLIQEYARKIGHTNFIGYFGDTAQNIYENGVGSKITEIHSDLLQIKKKFNRRSSNEVIDVINKIRNDEIKQVSIYDDCDGGSVKFYAGTPEDVDDFINKSVNEWGINSNNKLHCLVLTNKMVAKYSGFENIYSAFSETQKYSGLNYNLLNTELLSNDLSKLGEIQRLLYNVVGLKEYLSNPQVPVIKILLKDTVFEKMNLIDLRELVEQLKQIEGKNLEDYVNAISGIYSEDSKGFFKKIMNLYFPFENITLEKFKDYLLEKLFTNLEDDDINTAKLTIQKLIEIDIDDYVKWYGFINDKPDDMIVYHTYHGTKGREFDNVLIIMENSFGKTRNYFNFFFENYLNSNELEGKNKEDFEKVKNLLYVSCSRAIKNLNIFFIDDINNFESGIKNIFGETYVFRYSG